MSDGYYEGGGRIARERSLSTGDLLVVLARPRWRLILESLPHRPDWRDVESLATSIAQRERRSGDDGDADRVYVSLVHADLPHLDDRGFVEYDDADGIARLSVSSSHLDELLGSATDAIERFRGH